MAIYRGPGGSGDAVNDSSSEVTLAVQARDAALAAQAAAEAARDQALIAETNAETAETNAEQAETNAELAESNAETAQAAAEEARDASINLATNFDVDANTLSAGSSATASYDTETFLLTLGIPRGDTGATGAKGDKGDTGDTGAAGADGADGADGDDGRGIVSIARTSGTGAAGTTDTFTITYTDATTSTFQVYNGADGVDGTDGTNGTNGTDGADGADGRGIVSITRTAGDGSAGTTDTYTITYTDSTTSTFSVYNGADGTGSGTVSSVALSVPTGLSVSGSPITTTGTLAVTYAAGYSIPTTASQGNWDTAYGWGNHASAGYLDTADIGTTVQAYDSNLTSFVGAFTLPTTDGTSGQVLSTNGSGTLAFSTPPAGYTNSDVDAHLNTSTATTGQVLGWSGTDYDWVDQSGGSSTITINNKTGAYTVVAGDLGKVIRCTTNAFTVSLTAAATLGSGFNVTIWNKNASNGNAITIDPAGSETINGASTLILRAGEGVQLVCDGTNWSTGYGKAPRGYADNMEDNADIKPQAAGSRSVAIGAGASASAANSLAIGYFTQASGNFGTAIGLNSSGGGSQAVTGTAAMALGGSRAAGTNSFAAAIAVNTSSYGATGDNSVAIGYLAKSTAIESYALGSSASATAIGALALGNSATASGLRSKAFGFSQASLAGQYAFGGYSPFSSGGDAQQSLFILMRQTTNDTPTVLTTDRASAALNNQVILPNNSTRTFRIQVVAMQQAAGGTNTAGYTFEGVIRRGANAAATVLKNSTKTVLHEDDTAWDCNISADTTNGGLAVTVTGAAATNIRWVATVNTTEVTYA